jgi:thiol-disulfide isomerase/thioredoxin
MSHPNMSRPMLRLKSTATDCRVAALEGLCLLASLPVFAGDFSVRDLHGKAHSLAAHRGQWVLVNFWGTWCPPCLSEIPELNSLQAAHKNLVVIGVAIQSGTSAEVADFVAAHQMVYPVVMGSRAITEQIRSAASFKEELEGLPTSFLFGPKGELVYDQAGEITRKTIEKLMQSRQSN